jgi:hypothetical protein
MLLIGIPSIGAEKFSPVLEPLVVPAMRARVWSDLDEGCVRVEDVRSSTTTPSRGHARRPNQ